MAEAGAVDGVGCVAVSAAPVVASSAAMVDRLGCARVVPHRRGGRGSGSVGREVMMWSATCQRPSVSGAAQPVQVKADCHLSATRLHRPAGMGSEEYRSAPFSDCRACRSTHTIDPACCSAERKRREVGGDGQERAIHAGGRVKEADGGGVCCNWPTLRRFGCLGCCLSLSELSLSRSERVWERVLTAAAMTSGIGATRVFHACGTGYYRETARGSRTRSRGCFYVTHSAFSASDRSRRTAAFSQH